MERVVLLFDRDCAKLDEARRNLAAAFAAAEVVGTWTELELDGVDTPEAWRGYASPTVLVDGRDALDVGPGSGPGCRLEVPAVELLVARLRG